MNLDNIAQQFVATAIWADAPEGTQPRAPRAAIRKAREFAAAFVAAHPQLVADILATEDYGWCDGVRDTDAALGHDLCLTAAGHGAGFWDRDSLSESGLGDRATEALRGAYVASYFYRGWLYLEAKL